MTIRENSALLSALNVVRQSCRLVKLIESELVLPAIQKDDRSPVTVADFASQALIAKHFLETNPGISLVGEENSTAIQTAEARPALDTVTAFITRLIPDATPLKVCHWIDHGAAQPGGTFWTLDPIDGTKGFLRGDQYVVALALIEDGLVKIAILGCPNLSPSLDRVNGGSGSLVYAVQGQGTWIQSLEDNSPPQQLLVSDCRDPQNARVLRSFEKAHTNVSQVDKFGIALNINAAPVRLDSQAKYALLAGGKGDLLLRLISPARPDYREKIWDQAAGSLILEEAGGMITDLDGKPLDFTTGRQLENNRGVLATNGILHNAALQAIRSIQA